MDNPPIRHTSTETDFITPGEAAAMSGLSLRTLARLADRGEVTAYELPSGHRRYARASIRALIRTSAA